ncbi:MAG: hypothetical protein K0R29_2411 [Pseudobdellovibrio sp.]|nr:hypothetical protein [Pseudobdellovibrio sp.]
MSTESVATPYGPAHMEVQSFDVSNSKDLAEAKRQIEQSLGDKRTQHLYQLNVTASDHIPRPSDSAAQAAINEIAQKVDARHKSPQKNIKVEPARPGFLKRHYNTTLAVVRFIANGATVTIGLIVGKEIPLEHALIIGALTGTMSAAIQLKSDKIMKWLSNSVLMVNAAKKAGLIKSTPGEDPSRAEKTLKEVEMYGRWASLETAFLLVCETAMKVLDIPIAENILLTVAKSTASQGVYEVGVLKTINRLEDMNPELASRHNVYKNVALFAGSGISVLAAVGALVGIPYANLGFLVLTGTGAVLNFGPKLVKSKPVEQIMRMWRPRRVNSCHALAASAN